MQQLHYPAALPHEDIDIATCGLQTSIGPQVERNNHNATGSQQPQKITQKSGQKAFRPDFNLLMQNAFERLFRNSFKRSFLL